MDRHTQKLMDRWMNMLKKGEMVKRCRAPRLACLSPSRVEALFQRRLDLQQHRTGPRPRGIQKRPRPGEEPMKASCESCGRFALFQWACITPDDEYTDVRKNPYNVGIKQETLWDCLFEVEGRHFVRDSTCAPMHAESAAHSSGPATSVRKLPAPDPSSCGEYRNSMVKSPIFALPSSTLPPPCTLAPKIK